MVRRFARSHTCSNQACQAPPLSAVSCTARMTWSWWRSKGRSWRGWRCCLSRETGDPRSCSRDGAIWWRTWTCSCESRWSGRISWICKDHKLSPSFPRGWGQTSDLSRGAITVLARPPAIPPAARLVKILPLLLSSVLSSSGSFLQLSFDILFGSWLSTLLSASRITALNFVGLFVPSFYIFNSERTLDKSTTKDYQSSEVTKKTRDNDCSVVQQSNPVYDHVLSLG